MQQGFRRLFLSGTVILCTFVQMGLNQQGYANNSVSVAQLEEYLEALDTLRADFIQSNADGTKSEGVIFLQRPRKARIRYFPPDTGIIIAQGGSVSIFDTKSNTGPTVAPVGATPLAPLLSRRIDLTDPNIFLRHLVGTTFNEIHLGINKGHFKGHVELQFLNDPITLIGWVYVDEFGNRTSLHLNNPQWGIKLDQRIFNIALQKEVLGLE